MKNYTTWLKAASISQFIFAVIHTLTLFITPPQNNVANETEKQLLKLMDTYQFDFGAGIHRTMNELTFVFSTSLSLLLILSGLINWFLLRKRTDSEVMKGIININLIVFGICFVVVAMYAFHFPIVLSGIIFIFLILARISLRNSINKV